MTIGPTVLRQRATPFASIACALLALFFVAQALLVDARMTVLSGALAAVFAAGAVWYRARAGRSAVVIDADRFVVVEGSRQRAFARADVVAVDLSSARGQVTLADGRSVHLPLEGRPLVEAGLLLSPHPGGP